MITPDLLSKIVGWLVPISILFVLLRGVKVVPQSKVFIVERFGKYHKTLTAGLGYVIPFLDNVIYKVDILERQLKDFQISVVTKDNVEVDLISTVFFRVTDAAKAKYRISDVEQALRTTAVSIIRSAAGKLELDDLQSSRDSMINEIAENLKDASDVWGIEITRTEVLDIVIDDLTKEAQRQQLNAERERRASIAKAEGVKKGVELNAEAKYYESVKIAEAEKIQADAEAYSILAKAKAKAEQIRLLGAEINSSGKTAVEYEVLLKQIEGLSSIASSNSAKTVVIPSDITKTLGTIQAFANTIKGNESN